MRPVFPQQQTSLGSVATSAKCQKQTLILKLSGPSSTPCAKGVEPPAYRVRILPQQFLVSALLRLRVTDLLRAYPRRATGLR